MAKRKVNDFVTCDDDDTEIWKIVRDGEEYYLIYVYGKKYGLDFDPRFLCINGKLYCVATDMARLLGYKDPRRTAKRYYKKCMDVDKCWDKNNLMIDIPTFNKNQDVTVRLFGEYVMYLFIAEKSKNKEATDWAMEQLGNYNKKWRG